MQQLHSGKMNVNFLRVKIIININCYRVKSRAKIGKMPTQDILVDEIGNNCIFFKPIT